MDENLEEMLIRHEGLRLLPYIDTMGKLTIGVGRNLYDVGVSRDEALYLLRNDLVRVEQECRAAFPWFGELTEKRQIVILNMCFNLGLQRLLEFSKMIAAVVEDNYDTAASEMLMSRWAKQVGARATELANLMRGVEPL